MKLTSVAFALALVVPIVAGADDKAPPSRDTTETDKDVNKKQAKKLGEPELKIVSHLHHVNMMEIDLGNVAQRSGTAPVKKYAEMLVTDHQMADKLLTKFAKDRGTAMIPAKKPETEA